MKNKIIFICLIVVSVILNAFIIKFQGQPAISIDSILIDGIFVWAVDKFLTIGMIPIIIYITFLRDLYNEKNLNIVIRKHNRIMIWIEESNKLFILTLIAFILDLSLSFIMSIILNGFESRYSLLDGDDFYKYSYLGVTSLLYDSINGCPKLHFFNILAFILINLAQIYLLLIVANCIRWTLTPIVSYIFLYGVCGVIGVNHASKNYGVYKLGIKSHAKDFYYEILNINLFLKKFLIAIIIILIANITVRIFMNRKNFL